MLLINRISRNRRKDQVKERMCQVKERMWVGTLKRGRTWSLRSVPFSLFLCFLSGGNYLISHLEGDLFVV